MPSARFFLHKHLAQLRIDTPDDLDRVRELDAARWSATSVPNEQLFTDPAFLAAIDADKNGRVRRHEVLAALEWLKPRLKNRARMFADKGAQPSDAVRLADIDVTHPDGARIVQLAKLRLGKGDGADDVATLAEIRAFADAYKKKHPNGDGVVTAAQCDGDLGPFVAKAIETVGGVIDASGELGVDDAKLDALLARADEQRAWTAGRTWRNDVDAAADALLALAPKLDQFFGQCDLLGQEQNAAARLSASAEELAALDVADPKAVRAWLEKAPLARPTTAAVLDGAGWLNPLHADAVTSALSKSLPALFGTDEPLARLTRADWERAQQRLAPIAAHKAKKPAPLPPELEAVNKEDPRVVALRKRIEEDRTASNEIAGIADLERIALMQRWLVELLNNMVSFPTLFRAHGRALFEAGTLVLDGRELHFCVRAPDIAAHKPVAEKSNLFVVYAELVRKDGDLTKTQQIAAAVTSGQRRGIAVGKRGVFYDRDGKEHDARVIEIIERPISLLEAALAPFVRVRDAVLGFIERTTSGKLSALEKQATDASTTVPAAPAPAPTAVAVAPQGGGLASKLMGGGVAIAALGSGAAFTLQTIAGIALVDALMAIASVAGGIAVLAGFLGWLKLRRRDLSTMLEACGWAFNVRLYLTRKHALRFTRVPPLPKDAERERVLLPAIAAEEESAAATGVLVWVLAGALAAAAYAFREPLMKLLRLE